MGRKILSLLAFAFLIGYSTCSDEASTGQYENFVPQPWPYDENVGDPLFLTGLIEMGRVEEARKLAMVQHVQMQGVESYSAYLTVNKQYNSNVFFWFFPAEVTAAEAPLVLWMNGGPGTSSLRGLFYENGPFIVLKNLTLAKRTYSWHKNHNLLYIDQPVGSGYSFTKDVAGLAVNQKDVAHNLLETLIQFFKLFPDYRMNDFYITGESYAGKYIPAISYAIKIYNAQFAAPQINLKGLAIGNGAIDPVHNINVSDYLLQLGLIDINGYNYMNKLVHQAIDLYKQGKYEEAGLLKDTIFTGVIHNGVSLFKNLTGFTFRYNYLLNRHPINYYWYEKFAKMPSVRRALHVGNIGFNTQSDQVYRYLLADQMKSVAPLLVDLLQTYRVLIFSGQLDLAIPYTTTEQLLYDLEWPGAERYRKTARKQWWMGKEIAGYWKIIGNLTEVIVRNAGHMVPADQPLWAFELISRFTHHNTF